MQALMDLFVSPVPIGMGKDTKKLTTDPNHSNMTSFTRRSASYKPSSWDYDAIQAHPSSHYLGEAYVKREEELKQEVIRHMFRKEDMEAMPHLELIDTIQCLGLEHRFVKEVESSLQTVTITRNYNDIGYYSGGAKEDDLYATALHFKLLRLHGRGSSQDMFKKFVDDDQGAFRICLKKDVKGLLSLFEASQLGFQGESLLDEAKAFCVHHLQDHVLQAKNCGAFDQNMIAQVEHALKFPLCQRIPWTEIRWHIEHCGKRSRDIHSSLLQMAQLNFNMEQARHQNELKSISRWWRSVGLGTKLEFARDRYLEAYFASLATIPEPQFAYARKMLAKIFLLVTTIDDMYDIYGTVQELELFTHAVNQWDVNAIDQLPEYMKICFLALFNEINKLSYQILKETGLDITSFLSKMWGNLCTSFMTEAKWFHSRYMPSFQEYLNNGIVSSSGPLVLVHAYCCVNQKIKKEDLQFLTSDPQPVTLASLLFRLCNDLGTSEMEAKRGDTPGCVQCYARDSGSSEEAARSHIMDLVEDTWKRLIKECVPASSCPKLLANLAMALARAVQSAYQKGDAYGRPDHEMKVQMQSILLQPILMEQK